MLSFDNILGIVDIKLNKIGFIEFVDFIEFWKSLGCFGIIIVIFDCFNISVNILGR